MFLGEGWETFHFRNPTKKITGVHVRRVLGPSNPPDELVGKHLLPKDTFQPLHHQPGVIGLVPILLLNNLFEPGPTQAIFHDWEDHFLQQVPVAELVDPLTKKLEHPLCFQLEGRM